MAAEIVMDVDRWSQTDGVWPFIAHKYRLIGIWSVSTHQDSPWLFVPPTAEGGPFPLVLKQFHDMPYSPPYLPTRYCFQALTAPRSGDRG
jgi:hypothetical protein